MTLSLSDPELRVLGVLLEKQRTTPDDYPLTANSVMRACNQSSSRDPIVHYEPGEVEAVLRGLREQQLTRVVHSTSNRAAKHRHVLDDLLGIDGADQAVLCLLMLRGPQTPGELKTRSARLHPFADLGEVQATLDRLAAREEPLVKVLPRRAGHKEARWGHLLGASDPADFEPSITAAETAPSRSALEARVSDLEAEVDRLRAELAHLVDRLGDLLD